jgi:hypothetical protein
VLTFVSPAAELMLDQDPAEWVGRPLADLVDEQHAERVGVAIGDARS